MFKISKCNLIILFKAEFHRAVKISTGASLSPHVVRCVFLVFDQDGDGRLSDKEFISIMRDRIHRGLQVIKTFLPIWSFIVELTYFLLITSL